MGANPFLGVFFHWLGGLASASFYIPYRGVKKWAWETYWLVGGFFSWIIAPAVLAWLLVPNMAGVLRHSWSLTTHVDLLNRDVKIMVLAYIFGAMWGMGGLTFGLTMRYLGIALGMAIALSYCTVFGTLVPTIFDGSIKQIIHEPSGRMVLLGLAVCVGGIVVSGLAGMSKDREMTEEQKKATVKEFSFAKGLLVATFSGIMSASFAYGLAAGKPIAELAKAQLLQHGGADLWQNLPVLVVVLWGGFTTNFIWCVILNIKNRTGHQYLAFETRGVSEISATEGVINWDAEELGKKTSGADTHGAPASSAVVREAPGQAVPVLSNYVFSAIAGVTWYLQFFFYSMGQTKMGKFEFSSWTLHMASIIIFSTLWGVVLKEWKGTSKRTHALIAFGLLVLIGSTIIVGYGNFLKGSGPAH